MPAGRPRRARIRECVRRRCHSQARPHRHSTERLRWCLLGRVSPHLPPGTGRGEEAADADAGVCRHGAGLVLAVVEEDAARRGIGHCGHDAGGLEEQRLARRDVGGREAPRRASKALPGCPLREHASIRSATGLLRPGSRRSSSSLSSGSTTATIQRVLLPPPGARVAGWAERASRQTTARPAYPHQAAGIVFIPDRPSGRLNGRSTGVDEGARRRELAGRLRRRSASSPCGSPCRAAGPK